MGLKIHPRKTKVLSNQSSISPDSKKEMQIGDVKIEILTRSESVRNFGQLIHYSIKKRPKSKIVSGQPGRRFTNTGKS